MKEDRAIRVRPVLTILEELMLRVDLLVSPSGGFASLLFDQGVPYYSQRHLANRNTICILHRSDCAWLCCS